jgi:hypothetical protein
MGRSDPALNYLKQYGYSVVRLPRADLPPGSLLERDGGDLVDLGGLQSVFQAGDTAAPKVHPNERVVDMSGHIKTTLSLGLGLSLLGQFLKALGGTTVGLEGEFKQAKTLTFEFDDPYSDSIAPADLEKFLARADVDPRSVNAHRLLDEDKVYVVTRTLKAKQFLLEGKNERQAGVKVNVPAISGIVGADVKIGTSRESSSKLSFEGKELLVFGIQAVRLFYEGNRFVAYRHLPPGSATKRGARAATEKPQLIKAGKEADYLSAQGAFVNIAK